MVPQRVDVRTLKIPIPKYTAVRQRNVHHSCYTRPTVQLRDDTVKYAVRQAEKIRVQLRDLKAASIKEGSWPKHSKEVTAVSGKLLLKGVA